LLGGLVVPLFDATLHQKSPYYLLSRWIYHLPWTCAAKQWTWAGVCRIVIDVLQLGFVDFFNKFRRRRRAREDSMDSGASLHESSLGVSTTGARW